MKRAAMTIIALVAALAVGASAQVPQTLNYQGVLTDAGGVVVADGDYSIVFSLYDVASGGSDIWSNTKTVSVSHGIFSVVLGESVPIDLDFDTQYYLGIAVEGEAELAPRVALTSSAYSMNARGVTGDSNVFPPDGAVGIGTATPGYPLHILTSDITGIRVDGTAIGSWATIRINADGLSSQPALVYMREGSHKAMSLVDAGDDWNLRLGGTDVISAEHPSLNVGIGISDPSEKLDVDGAVKIGTTAGANAGSIRWTGADFEGYDGGSWLSLTGGGGSLPSGTAGQTLRHDGSNWVANSGIYNNGTYVGIGITTPQAKLNVGGGQWDLEGTEGDFKIGDDLYRLKFGVATGGGGAGSAGIRVQGGMEKLILGAGSAEVLHIDNTGTAGIGSEFWTGDLEIYQAGYTDPMLHLYPSGIGGYVRLYDEMGNSTIHLEPDVSGDGGYFYVKRSAAGTGFRVDGNYMGSNEPMVEIVGSSNIAGFYMNNTGDTSVELPVDAVASNEVLDEAGTVSYGNSSAVSLADLDYTTIASQSITAPAQGYVLVIGTTQAQASHTNGTDSRADFGVSSVPTLFPDNQDVTLHWVAQLPTNPTYRTPVTVHSIFEVDSGIHTFYFLGYEHSGSFTCWDTQLSIIYIPTAYGTIGSATLAGAIPGDDSAERVEITAGFVESQRRESQAANDDRIRRELEEVRARLQELESMVQENR